MEKRNIGRSGFSNTFKNKTTRCSVTRFSQKEVLQYSLPILSKPFIVGQRVSGLGLNMSIGILLLLSIVFALALAV